MLQVLKVSKSNPSKPLPPEIKEFISQLEVVHVEDKGRGLQAQQDFAPGDLIMAQRALAIVFPDLDSSAKSSLLNKVKRFRLLKETVTKLLTISSEELETNVCSLHAGPKLGFMNKDQIVKGLKNKVSASRIEGILIVNGFEGQSREALEGPFGLWYLPSFLNHDCFKTNANWEIYNDFMFIRATKLIPKGQEVLIREGADSLFVMGYIDPDQPYFVRREMFLKHNFVCGCKLCFLEKKEGEDVWMHRDSLLSEFKDYINSGDQPDTAVIQEFLDNLTALRPNPSTANVHFDVNPFLLQPLMQLGLVYFEQQKYRKALSTFENAFKVCESFTQFYSAAFILSVTIVSCYLKLGVTNLKSDSKNEDQIEIWKWIAKVKQSLLIQYGSRDDEESYEILKFLKPDFVKEMEENGFSFSILQLSHNGV